MHIQLSSNVVNGIYSLLEVLVLAIFSRCLTTIIGCWNVKRIYDDKKDLQLTSSPFKHFADLGLTSRSIQLVGLMMFSLVLGLMTAGGYSVRGVTVSNDVQVPNLVKLADEGEIMDLSDHIDSDLNLVSGSVLLMLDAYHCARTNSNIQIVYQYINSLYDITAPKWGIQGLENSTCLTGEAEGGDAVPRFEVGIIEESILEDIPEGFLLECNWSVDGTDFPVGKVTKAIGHHSSRCAFPLLEGWCLRTERNMYCAGVFRDGDEFLVGILEGISPSEQTFIHEGNPRITRQPTTRQIQSMVQLLSVLFLPYALRYEFMTRLVVKKNAQIRGCINKRDITELNVLLFLLTAGVAMLITFAACIAAAHLWLTVIYFPGRTSYNRFNSAMDLMSYAANVSSIAADQRLRRHRAIAVGIRTSDSDVGPIGSGMQDRVSNATSKHELN